MNNNLNCFSLSSNFRFSDKMNNRTFDKSPSAVLKRNVQQIKEQTQKLQNNAKEAVRRLPVVLTEPQLKRLKVHKYASEGTTLVDPIMQVFWKWLVEFCPLWVAPNLLTIVGLTLNIGTAVLLMIETNGAKEQVFDLEKEKCRRNVFGFSVRVGFIFLLLSVCLFINHLMLSMVNKHVERILNRH